MELTLTRQILNDKSTIGPLHIGDVPFCEILEDVDRKLELYPSRKIKGQTAIPRGRYQIVVTESARFGRLLPILLDVPGYTGVRIHPGNKHEDTDGCLLPGQWVKDKPNWVAESGKTFDELFKLIQAELAEGHEVWITIQ